LRHRLLDIANLCEIASFKRGDVLLIECIENGLVLLYESLNARKLLREVDDLLRVAQPEGR
jgi:hypothetical protein